ncbi:MAG: hypothetical protein V3T97_06825 [Gemmatimonadota bacterium]|nr:DUF4031 domain-containing protein [Gemmatimonadota bacterium]
MPGREIRPPVMKFHYHSAPRDLPRLGVRRGDPMCHVYSDRSLAELITWGREHALRSEWIDRRNALPHFDAFGERLKLCGPGVSRAELVRDLRWWRAQRA